MKFPGIYKRQLNRFEITFATFFEISCASRAVEDADGICRTMLSYLTFARLEELLLAVGGTP
jgi:hypothetical protein